MRTRCVHPGRVQARGETCADASMDLELLLLVPLPTRRPLEACKSIALVCISLCTHVWVVGGLALRNAVLNLLNSSFSAPPKLHATPSLFQGRATWFGDGGEVLLHFVWYPISLLNCLDEHACITFS